mmetsp:Transcript_45890/g.92619  ORF Transcript_45890/g.92619 Transcript_45890/m.92619 type:complete len:378 (+) Transcript_45890:3-1136(+)
MTIVVAIGTRRFVASLRRLHRALGTEAVVSLSDEERKQRLAYLQSWASGATASPNAAPLPTVHTQPTATDKFTSDLNIVPATIFSLPVVRLRKEETVESLAAVLARGLWLQNSSELCDGKKINAVVVDLSELDLDVDDADSVAKASAILRTLNTAAWAQPPSQLVVPVGLFVAGETVKDSADSAKLSRALGLPALRPTPQAQQISSGVSTPTFGKERDSAPTAAAAKVPASASPLAASASTPGVTFYEGSVRSGQQVYASAGQSLLINGSVNPGGEVLADGSIFIWGALRGRAHAGISSTNPEEASKLKVAAQRFDAELVSVAQAFATIDSMPHGVHAWARDSPTTITLDRGGDDSRKTGGSGSREPRLVFVSEPAK